MTDITKNKFKKQKPTPKDARGIQIGLAIKTIRSLTPDEVGQIAGYTNRMGLQYQYNKFLNYLSGKKGNK